MNAIIDAAIGEQPPVTRAYVFLSSALMAACSLELLSPFQLYLNWHLVLQEFQIWRLFTCFLFFGTFGLPFFWNAYVLVFYCASLEDMSFRGRPADFLWMLLSGSWMLLFIAYFFDASYFISGAMIDIMTYLWGRRNPHARVHVIFITVRAPYLPWALAFVSLLMGAPVQDHIYGIIVGHMYYFFEDVYPLMPTSKGFRLFATPKPLKWICGQR
ncbi:unnamed protein product [Amoebophrya sp. A25]|nr:unnamed protein product [Amoebophrya sp. A25]|eukprot:GSA25T00009262001.1